MRWNMPLAGLFLFPPVDLREKNAAVSWALTLASTIPAVTAAGTVTQIMMHVLFKETFGCMIPLPRFFLGMRAQGITFTMQCRLHGRKCS